MMWLRNWAEHFQLFGKR